MEHTETTPAPASTDVTVTGDQMTVRYVGEDGTELPMQPSDLLEIEARVNRVLERYESLQALEYKKRQRRREVRRLQIVTKTWKDRALAAERLVQQMLTTNVAQFEAAVLTGWWQDQTQPPPSTPFGNSHSGFGPSTVLITHAFRLGRRFGIQEARGVTSPTPTEEPSA